MSLKQILDEIQTALVPPNDTRISLVLDARDAEILAIAAKLAEIAVVEGCISSENFQVNLVSPKLAMCIAALLATAHGAASIGGAAVIASVINPDITKLMIEDSLKRLTHVHVSCSDVAKDWQVERYIRFREVLNQIPIQDFSKDVQDVVAGLATANPNGKEVR